MTKEEKIQAIINQLQALTPENITWVWNDYVDANGLPSAYVDVNDEGTFDAVLDGWTPSEIAYALNYGYSDTYFKIVGSCLFSSDDFKELAREYNEREVAEWIVECEYWVDVPETISNPEEV